MNTYLFQRKSKHVLVVGASDKFVARQVARKELGGDCTGRKLTRQDAQQDAMRTLRRLTVVSCVNSPASGIGGPKHHLP